MDEIADTKTVLASACEEGDSLPKRRKRSRVARAPELTKVTLIVRPRLGAANWAQACLLGGSVETARNLLRAASSQPQGADPKDLEKVAAFARENQMTVLQSNAMRRWVVVQGDSAAVGKAFGVDLERNQSERSEPRPFETPICAPRALAGIVEAVLGLFRPNS
jgi:hypothetical protein